MNKDDFRYMRQKKQIQELKTEDLQLLEPLIHHGKKTDHALMVLHGFSSSPAVYRYLIPKIKAHYDTIVCPALPGHAHSIEKFSHTTAYEWQTKANELCGELTLKYQCVDVLGFSLGGLLALNLSQLFELNHLYLLAPSLKLRSKLNGMIRLAKILKGLGFQDLRNMAGNLLSAQHAEIAYRKLPLKIILEILQFIDSFQWVAPTCTVDLFLGAQDDVVASAEIEAFFTPLSNVSIHWLNNSAHVLPLDNDLQQIIQCIESRGTAYCKS